jgi:ring-1,2-phenylacetyl-CoA epoxidase subunit PaaA
MVLTLMSGTKKQKALAQDAFDRWWGPSVMFFGPPDKPDAENRPAMKWRMKTVRNEDLRQRFVNRFAPAAIALGLKIHVVKKNDQGEIIKKKPDENIRLNESTGDWGFTQPDWDEFFKVIRGGGPCNQQRVGLRRFSYEQGRGVRRSILRGTQTAPPAA